MGKKYERLENKVICLEDVPDPYVRFAFRMIQLACDDAQGRNVQRAAAARRWLLGPGGQRWARFLDLQPGELATWVRKLPLPGR